MATITTRAGKGSPLTNTEVDNNFTNINTELGQKESASNKGVANGYASLDGSGKVPSTQLPSYVDDVVEGANLAALPATGETGKIYVTLDTNKTYRWSGSAYVEISASPGSTDAVTEGSTNLYFTNARARAAVSASGSLSYNTSTGIFSYTQPTNVSTFTNDSGYLTGITGAQVTTALGFTPYNATNPSGYITGITSGMVTTALGYTPYNSSNPSGYITSSSLSSYLPLSGGTLTGDLLWSGIYPKIGINDGGADCYIYITDDNPTHDGVGYGGEFWLYGDKSVDASLLRAGGAAFTYAPTVSGNRVLHAGNYNDYAPSKTGTGASGTWGISITGSAGSATTATRSTIEDTRAAQRTPNDYTDFRASYEFTDRITGLGDWHTAFTMQGWHDGYAAWQIIGPASTSAHENWYLRSGINSSWNPVRAILHAGNYTSYSLPITGGTMTGNVTYDTGNGEIIVSPTGWRSSDRAAIKIRSKADAPAEIDLRHTSGGIESGWHLSARAASEGAQLSFYKFNMDSAGAADASSFNLMAQLSANGAFNAVGAITQNGSQVLHAGNYGSYALPLSGGTLTGTLYFTDTTNGLSKSGGRLTVRSESTDNVANFAGYGLYLPVSGATAGLYVESPIEARSGLRIGNGAGSGTITVGADTSETASRLVQRDSSGGIFGTYIRARKNQTAGDYTTAALWTESYGNTATGIAFHISGNVGKFLEMRTNGTLYWNGDTVIHSGNYSSWALPASGGTLTGTLNVSNGNVIQFYTNNGSLRGYINATDTDDNHLQIATSGGEDIVFKDGGLGGTRNLVIRGANAGTEAYGSMRSPIFYDNGDTNYYADPAGTSQFYQARFVNRIAVGNGSIPYLNTGTAGIWFSNSGGSSHFAGSHDSDNSWWGVYTNSAWRSWLTGSGSWITTGDQRAPIWYDYNDTSFYLDPASTTTSLQIAGAVEQGNNFAHPNVEWSASSSSSGMVIFKLPGGSGNYGMVHMVFDIYEYNSPRIATVIVGGHNWNGSWYNNACNVIGYTDKQVRLGFKDGQYCVVFGTSGSGWSYGTIRLRKIHNGSFYNNQMDLGGSYSVSQTTTESFSAITGDLRGLRTPSTMEVDGILYGYNSIRSNIFYDNDNTGYYCDPASSSRLSTIYCGDVYNDLGGWFRNYGATGIYNQSYGNHFYSDSANYWNVGIGGQTSGGIRFRDTHAGTVRGYVYVDNGNNIGFLNSGGSWRARVVADDYFLVEGSSSRAQIFYDSNNTGYYVDPASTSNVNSIQIAGVINQSGPGRTATVSTSNYDAKIGSSDLYIYTKSIEGGAYPCVMQVFRVSDGATSWPLNLQPVGSGVNIGSYGDLGYKLGVYGSMASNDQIRAPIFYDYNDTGYYFDGASTTRANAIHANSIGVNQGINGSWPLIVNGNAYLNGGGYGQAEGSWRAPIFYDSNDTSYYCNPNDWSLLWGLRTYYIQNNYDVGADHPFGLYFANGGSTAYAIYRESGAWNYPYPDLRIAFHTGIKLGANASYQGIRFYDDYNMAGQVMSVNNGSDPLGASNVYVNNSLQAGSSLRAPIFYDSNDTGYYTDPASTSVLSTLKTLSQIYINNGDPTIYLQDTSHRSSMIHCNSNVFYILRGSGTNSTGWSTYNGYWPLEFNLENNDALLGGNITAVYNVTAYSDERLKKNWRPLSEGFVERLAGVKNGIYERISKEEETEITQVGVSAQSLREVLPEAVTEASDEMKTLSVSYGNAALAAAVELAREVVTLKSQISAMSAEINSLKERLQ